MDNLGSRPLYSSKSIVEFKSGFVLKVFVSITIPNTQYKNCVINEICVSDMISNVEFLKLNCTPTTAVVYFK